MKRFFTILLAVSLVCACGDIEPFPGENGGDDQIENGGDSGEGTENEGTGHEGVAQALQQDFAQIGITMDISVEDWQTFLNDRKSGNFDVAREGWLADYDDPINMLEMFTSDSGNNDMQLGK